MDFVIPKFRDIDVKILWPCPTTAYYLQLDPFPALPVYNLQVAQLLPVPSPCVGNFPTAGSKTIPPHTELFPEKTPLKRPRLLREGLDAAERSLTKLTFVPGPLTKKWT